jgi:hypothetical protein
LLASFAWARTLWAKALPDSCGDDSVRFEVRTQTDPAAPGSPAEGKAQIFFIESENQAVAPFSYATVRYGVDGTWVGANHNNSHFAMTVDPGVHHLCANWQTSQDQARRFVHLYLLNAEPGQVYYFAAEVMVNSRYSTAFSFSQLNEDEGKYRVSLSKMSNSKSK